MPDPFHIEAVRIPGNQVALQHEGGTVRVIRSLGYVDYYARLEEQRLREAAGRRRPCLCCSAEFLSLGPHNRLCDGCRRTAHD